VDDFIQSSKGAETYHRFLKPGEEMSRELEEAVKRCMTNSGVDENHISTVIERLKNDHGYRAAISGHSAVASRHRRLLSIEKQTTRSDIESKLRFLLFRMLTAIGIAFVVLGTGYLAKTLGIPLPLLRL
jgi:hypothetical protein